MNTTDYFTYVNAMFLFCIFTCGLLVWAVIRGYILKGKLKKEQDSHLKATNTNTLLNKALSAKNAGLQANEHKLRAAEKEIRELQGKQDESKGRISMLELGYKMALDEVKELANKLTESEKQANGYKAEFIAVSNELETTKAKVRKRDKDGKFLPSGNGRVRTPKKLKLVTDLGVKEVIRCSTFEQAEKLYRLDDRILIQHWKVYKEDTAFYPEASQYSSLQFYEENGYTIHPASDFIARPKRVKKLKAVFDEISDYAKETSTALDNLRKLFSTTTLPKLVHGLTVKNPTDEEAKMIFDEAKRLGISTYAEHRTDLPFIWWSVTDTVSRCADSDWPVQQIFVTAQEFVQRMQNGRG